LRTPEAYIAWTNAHLGFNPRSQANSNALSDFVVTDLRTVSPEIDAAIQSERLLVVQNPGVRTKVAERSIDLVLRESAAKLVCVAVEHKTIMTAHGKARKNRYGDIIAYCNHMHNHRKECIAGAIIVVNTSPQYENPDGFAKGLVRPKFKMDKVVADTVGIFAQIPQRESPDEPNDQPEALAVIVMNYDGANPARLEDYLPEQSQIMYDTFIARIARLYVERFSLQR
jgi:CHAT domain-containing protein